MTATALRSVNVTGGSAADGAYLRSTLGCSSLVLKSELRMVSLGCADPGIVNKIAQFAGVDLDA